MHYTAWLALSAAAIPFLVGFMFARLVHLDAKHARFVTFVGAILAMIAGLLAGLGFLLNGPSTGTLAAITLGQVTLTFGAHVDALSAMLLVMVAIIGTVVSRYSIRYLDGDPDQARFSQWLAFTLSAVLFVIVARNLMMLWFAWVLTSLGLHQLLTYYSDRPAALLAARKKFVISRLGDLFLLIAFILTYQALGTLEYRELFARAEQLHGDPLAPLIGILFVLGAMSKSAQFPVHSWLPDTLETPTPVSALMHAGIINAGGFLLIRLSPLFAAAPVALACTALIGGFTAVFASVVMLTQTDIKRKLAYSTVGQMGFMMLQIGLGAFAVAAMHLVGHSFYKAHAFLSASSTVRTTVPQPPSGRKGVTATGYLLALLTGIGIVTGLAWALDVGYGHEPGFIVLGTVLAMAIAQLLIAARLISPRPNRATRHALRNGIGIALLYFALVAAFQYALDPVVADFHLGETAFAPFIFPLLMLAFLAALSIQVGVPRLGRTAFGRRLYVHAYNGFYLGTLQNRLIERFWPPLGRAHTAPQR
mgnify:CR=1 FL=1